MPGRISRTGRLYSISFSLSGLFIAYLLMSGMESSLLWVINSDIQLNLAVGAFGMLAAAYFAGPMASNRIAVCQKNAIITGVLTGFMILWAGTIAGSLVGLILEYEDNRSFIDYLMKPLYLVTLFGTIPVVIMGGTFGIALKKALQR